MGKLFARNGAEIIGTYERIPGCAQIQNVVVGMEGKFYLEYEGTTDVWWDGQETETDNADRLFIDEYNQLWRESELTFKESEDE